MTTPKKNKRKKKKGPVKSIGSADNTHPVGAPGASTAAAPAPRRRRSAAEGSRSWSEDEVWEALVEIIGNPPVRRTTPMSAVLIRISEGLLAQRINIVFFPPPDQSGAVSTTQVRACEMAGHLSALVCAHLEAQGRLRS